MTYFKLFAKCLSIATKTPVEDIMAKFNEFAEYSEPHPMLKQEAPDKVVKDLLAIAESDPESVVKWAVGGIPAALHTINAITKH